MLVLHFSREENANFIQSPFKIVIIISLLLVCRANAVCVSKVKIRKKAFQFPLLPARREQSTERSREID